jgi:DNA-binding transcriptional MerR regulator
VALVAVASVTMHEPLTETDLAEATGLPVATVRRYLQLYRPDLPPAGSGRIRRWEASCVETLHRIARLETAGYSVAQIESILAGHPLPPPVVPAPAPDVEPPPVPSAAPRPAGRAPRPEYTYEAETAALREQLRRARTPEHSPRRPRPWWAFWRRR